MRLVRVLPSGQCSWESKSVLEKYAFKYFNMPDTLDSLMSLQGPTDYPYPIQKASSTGNLDWVPPHILIKLLTENKVCFKTLILKGKAASSLLRVFWDGLIALWDTVEERIKTWFHFQFFHSWVTYCIHSNRLLKRKLPNAEETPPCFEETHFYMLWYLQKYA